MSAPILNQASPTASWSEVLVGRKTPSLTRGRGMTPPSWAVAGEATAATRATAATAATAASGVIVTSRVKRAMRAVVRTVMLLAGEIGGTPGMDLIAEKQGAYRIPGVGIRLEA